MDVAVAPSREIKSGEHEVCEPESTGLPGNACDVEEQNIDDENKLHDEDKLLDEEVRKIFDSITEPSPSLGGRLKKHRPEATLNPGNLTFPVQVHQMLCAPIAEGMEVDNTSNGVGPSTGSYERIFMFLSDQKLWREFRALGTEMVITKAGRRMFPNLVVSVSGLNPLATYTVFMDIVSVNTNRYKYSNKKWTIAGKAEEPETYSRYFHPESPRTGKHWMKHKISFQKAKITNNKETTLQHLVLNPMHKYQPRIHIVKEGDNIDDDCMHGVFEFVETTFIAVTAYQNDAVTQMKIDHNPFAKAFRDTPSEPPKAKLQSRSALNHQASTFSLTMLDRFASQLCLDRNGNASQDRPFHGPLSLLRAPEYKQEVPSHWPMAYGVMPSQVPAHITTEKAYTTPYNIDGQAVFASSSHKVPLTRTRSNPTLLRVLAPTVSAAAIQPPVVNPFSSYISTAPYGSMHLPNSHLQAGSGFNGGMDQS